MCATEDFVWTNRHQDCNQHSLLDQTHWPHPGSNTLWAISPVHSHMPVLTSFAAVSRSTNYRTLPKPNDKNEHDVISWVWRFKWLHTTEKTGLTTAGRLPHFSCHTLVLSFPQFQLRMTNKAPLPPPCFLVHMPLVCSWQGVPLVCVRWWQTTCDLRLNACPQMSHVCGFSPVSPFMPHKVCTAEESSFTHVARASSIWSRRSSCCCLTILKESFALSFFFFFVQPNEHKTLRLPFISDQFNHGVNQPLKKHEIPARLVNHRGTTLSDLTKRRRPTGPTCKSKLCPAPTICQRSHVVYLATCELCGSKYVGMTVRQLHARAVRAANGDWLLFLG